MDRVFEIRTADQLRVLGSPARRDIFEALLGIAEPGAGVPAREIAEWAGLSVESTHYHLGKLTRIGLVTQTGQRDTGGRPEMLFAPAFDEIELKRGKRGPTYVRELVRVVRLLLNRVERDYARAAPEGAFAARPSVSRAIGWMTPDEVESARKLTHQLERLVRTADDRARAGGLAGRERVSITTVLTPIEARDPADS